MMNYQDWSDTMQSMTKMRQDNDVIDRIGSLYSENKIELSWTIW